MNAATKIVPSRSQVRRSASRIRSGKARESDYVLLRNHRNLRADALVPACSHIWNLIAEDAALFTARLKRLESIIRKTIRLRTDISRMEDIVGVRVIVGTAETQMRLYKTIALSPSFVRAHDYISEMREDGYRALHIIMSITIEEYDQQYPVEIQLRTYLQHIWASLSELFGQKVKEGGGPKDVRQMLRDISFGLSECETAGGAFEFDHNTRQVLRFLLLHFDLRNAQIQDWLDLDQDVKRAVEKLVNYESYRQQTTAFETVLMCSRDKASIEKTHIRYFPKQLIKELTRTAGIKLPGWAIQRIFAPRYV